MGEISDYSGTFDPDFHHEQISSTTLCKLLKTYSENMFRVDGLWYVMAMDKLGIDEAYELDIKVWEKAERSEIRSISDVLNISGDDVATVMKYMQVYPIVWQRDYKIDLRNKNHAIVTYHTCSTLFALEKEGRGREKRQCQQIERDMLCVLAHYFNPEIQVTPLRVPPRTNFSDICCQWEFKLDR